MRYNQSNIHRTLIPVFVLVLGWSSPEGWAAAQPITIIHLSHAPQRTIRFPIETLTAQGTRSRPVEYLGITPHVLLRTSTYPQASYGKILYFYYDGVYPCYGPHPSGKEIVFELYANGSQTACRLAPPIIP